MMVSGSETESPAPTAKRRKLSRPKMTILKGRVGNTAKVQVHEMDEVIGIHLDMPAKKVSVHLSYSP
jgi:hypothetical protein